MNWLLIATTPSSEPLDKVTAEGARAALWSRVSSGSLTSFLILLLVGHVFSLPHFVVVSVVVAFASAALHTMAVGCLGGAYWESLKVSRAMSDYAESGLHSRAKRGALLGVISQSCALLTVPMAQFALLLPVLWACTFFLAGMSLFTAQYATETYSLALNFKERSRSTGAAWL